MRRLVKSAAAAGAVSALALGLGLGSGAVAAAGDPTAACSNGKHIGEAVLTGVGPGPAAAAVADPAPNFAKVEFDYS